jgi:hypothetical protein
LILDLQKPALIQRGAIIVYGPHDRPVGSLLRGCYWPGATNLSADKHADYLDTTHLTTPTFGSPEHLNAVTLTMHWLMMRDQPAEHRVLTALDALGQHTHGQRILGDIAGIGWNLIVNSLQTLESKGVIERRRSFIQLMPSHKGQYW